MSELEVGGVGVELVDLGEEGVVGRTIQVRKRDLHSRASSSYTGPSTHSPPSPH